jgi:hypothetical protein
VRNIELLKKTNNQGFFKLMNRLFVVKTYISKLDDLSVSIFNICYQLYIASVKSF